MRSRFAVGLAVVCLLAASAVHAQQVGTNVNMVTGTQWPGGDPFLQRQNEPSMAISSRNPLHMVAGDNDYRSVDLPAVFGEAAPTGDAWLGFFTSLDGGQTWTSTLVPGYPRDTSLAALLSPIHGLGAGADPTVRAGTNGMFYYSGLAFNRQQGGSNKVFVATYTDDNNLEGGNTIRYLWTTTVNTGTSNLFEDKPSIAVDIPRASSGLCIVPSLPLQNTQIFRAGTVYAAWTQFTGPESNNVASILYSRSTNCGLTWSRPLQISGTAKTNQGASLAIDPNTGALYVAWRVFASTNPTQYDAVMYVASFDGGNTFTKPQVATYITAFDQADTPLSFRTNDYPQITVDSSSRVYLSWSQRNVGNVSTNGGDARIMVATGTLTSSKTVPLQWSAPELVDPYPNRGHQIMPGMAFSAGKLTVAWYDLRNDDLFAIYTALGVDGQFSDVLENDGGAPDFPAFGTYIQDPATPYSQDARRQTLDVRAAQAIPGNPPSFFPSVQVTNYPYGSVPGNTEIQQLQVDPPNLPMFQSGTLPFFGDYIDVAGPTFIANPDGSWRFNNQSSDPDFTHVVWADNRDVVPPADGNWANYTPPTYGTSSTSIFDSSQQRPACTTTTSGNTGDRNQNIYTAGLTPGVVLSSPGNAKQLGTGSNGQLIQRQFAIVVANTTSQTRDYQLTVAAQPTGGVASFLQFAVAGQPYPLTQIEVEVPPLSSTSRGIFVTSNSVHASVTVSAAELNGLNGSLVSGGETGSVTINGDPNNPTNMNSKISTTESYTPTIANPNIANPNIANPNIANPNIANPNIANPNIANPNIANPNIANPNIANPNIANPNIANPNIANTALSDGTITDGTWAITNAGNTSSAYALNLAGQNPPQGVTLQLIVYQNYTTPLAQQCTLTTQSHFVPVANITNPSFATLSQLLQPAANNPTLPGVALAPGQTAYVTLRVYDANTNNPAQALLDYNPITQTTPVVVSQGANTGTTTPPLTLTILTKILPQETVTAAYPSQTLQATGGSGAYTWSIYSGSLPTGTSLSAAGVISGTLTGSAGTSSFTLQVKDAVGDIAQQPLTITVNPAPVISPASLTAATQGEAYSQSFSVIAGTGTGPFAFSASGLPAWLTFNAWAANLNGTAVAGSFNFTIKVTDASGVSASTSYSLLVNPAAVISPASLAMATQGEAYSQSFSVNAGTGTGPFAWSASGLPAWLTFNAATASLSGTAVAGSFGFTINVTDANGVSTSTSYTLGVNPAPMISPASLGVGMASTFYSQTFSVSAGTGTAPFNWGASGLPAWLAFNPATATLSGTAISGSFNFTINVTDANGVIASKPYTLLVNSLPSITTTTLLNGQYDTPYTPLTLSSSGGTAPYTWSLGTGGVLPSGMALAPSTGILSGTPAQAGVWSVPISVTDANSMTANTTLQLIVGLATAYAGSTCYMPYPTTPMYYLSNGIAGPWSVTAPAAFSGQLTFLGAGTVTVAGLVNTNGTAVTWASDQGGQNDQFVASPAPSSITINGVSYSVASINSATSLALTQSAGVQNFVAYSYTIPAGANMLTGCLSGAVSSGSYQVQFSAGTSSFSLPLQVVGQDQQDNTVVNANSSGMGADVPPSGYQQGVVTAGQSFTYPPNPGNLAADSGFSGNAVVGLNGTAPQICDTFAGLPSDTLLTAPTQAGRYDIAIDGTTQSCPLTAFPTSPAPIVFESVDALTTVNWGGATITNVALSTGNTFASLPASNVLEIQADTSPNPVTVAFNYNIVNGPGCPGCIDQLLVGLNTDAAPQTYAYSSVPGLSPGYSGSASLSINVPNTPGRYYIAIDVSEDYGFLYSSPYWWNGQPTAQQYIAVVDVW